MNSKRQTVWLVSMLSLMVVLSAYYLFTDSTGTGALKDTAQTQGTVAGATEVSGNAGLQPQDVAIIPGTDAGASNSAVQDGTGSDAAKTGDVQKDAADPSSSKETSGDAGLTPQDKAVLQQFEAGSASGQFSQWNEKSQNKINEQYDGILKKVNDPKQTADGSTKALAELDEFESRQEKIESLRKELGADYKNIVIDENGEDVTVVVQSEKLQKSQAAAIITKVSTELQINAGDVLVKYLP